MLDVVINTGSTSETCANLLKNLEWRVLRFHPEVVSILLGRNDAIAGPAGREVFQIERFLRVAATGQSASRMPNHVFRMIVTHNATSRCPNRIKLRSRSGLRGLASHAV
jgi:hypothetical protein